MPEKSIKSLSAKIVFFGTPEFSVPALEMLARQKGVELLAVTALARPVGRSQALADSAVAVAAQKLGVPVIQPESVHLPQFLDEVKKFNPDLFVVAAFGHILPQSLLNVPKKGALNIHPSLLPKLRGPSPIEQAIIDGEAGTGVSIMLMDAEIDHGPILASERATVKPDDTRLTLSSRLSRAGARLILKTIPRWLEGSIKPAMQDDTAATYTRLLTKEDGRIFWDKTADAIERRVRAYMGRPGSFFIWRRNAESLRCRIEAAHVEKGHAEEKPIGLVWQAAGAALAVQTMDGSLAIDRICLEGKSLVSGEEFVRGYPDIIGAMLL